MLRWADANGIRVLGYLLASAVAFFAAVGDRRDQRARRDAWPLFWFVTGCLLLAMALGRATDAGGWISNLGRQEAHTDGWYANRRAYQGLIILALGAGLVLLIAIAAWWIPRHRRRYVLAATIDLGLACYAAARAVSLHQVDALLYHRYIAGARFDAVIEVIGLGAAIGVALGHASKGSLRRMTSPETQRVA